MNLSIPKALVLGFSAIILFSGCAKILEQLDAQIGQHSTDSNIHKSELDQIDKDISETFNELEGAGKTNDNNQSFSSSPCGVTVDKSKLDQKIIVFTFDGKTSCFTPSRIRSGKIIVELVSGNRWQDAGAVLKQTFVNFKITRLSDDRKIEFNGIKTLENVNGHKWFQFFAGTTEFLYKSRANEMKITLDDSQNATWSHARKVSWSFVNGSTPYVEFSAQGDTTINGYDNVDSWGVNRYGKNFTTFYTQPLTSNTNCGLWRFKSGQLIHAVDKKKYTLTLGVDENGAPSNASCPYGYEVTWEVGNKIESKVFSY
ncbi:hypothetical protein ACFLR1_05335 [Bacteroidota bacterium]